MKKIVVSWFEIFVDTWVLSPPYFRVRQMRQPVHIYIYTCCCSTCDTTYGHVYDSLLLLGVSLSQPPPSSSCVSTCSSFPLVPACVFIVRVFQCSSLHYNNSHPHISLCIPSVNLPSLFVSSVRLVFSWSALKPFLSLYFVCWSLHIGSISCLPAQPCDILILNCAH